MFRNLKAIEIAEGALLADIAVIFILLSIYLPVGNNFCRIPVFIVFTVLVLRRGLYVGIMSAGISMFITGVLAGIGTIPLVGLVVSGGLFLGVTMRWRLPHIPLVLLGTTGGALALLLLILVVAWVSGGPTFRYFTRSFQAIHQFGIAVLGTLAANVGLTIWWQQHLYPIIEALYHFFITYLLLALYCGLWLLLCPIVGMIYIFTNMVVRMLGYDVRPLVTRKVNRAWQRLVKRLHLGKLLKKYVTQS